MASRVDLAVASARLLARLVSPKSRVSSGPDRAPTGWREQAFTLIGYAGLWVSLAISGALLFGGTALPSHATWLAWLKLGLGIVLIGEGAILATDWQHGRQLILWRMRLAREGRKRHAFVTWRFGGHLLSIGLQLVGVLWFAAGLFLAAIASQRLV